MDWLSKKVVAPTILVPKNVATAGVKFIQVRATITSLPAVIREAMFVVTGRAPHDGPEPLLVDQILVIVPLTLR